jgi:hypothetical protein
VFVFKQYLITVIEGQRVPDFGLVGIRHELEAAAHESVKEDQLLFN